MASGIQAILQTAKAPKPATPKEPKLKAGKSIHQSVVDKVVRKYHSKPLEAPKTRFWGKR